MIRELNLGGVNHGRVQKQVKTVSESMYHRETFPPQREAETTSSLLLKFDPKRGIF
jgi:hypothetical protein